MRRIYWFSGHPANFRFHKTILSKMFRLPVLFGWYVILGLYGACKSAADQTPVPFTFKEYQYKDSPKNVGVLLIFLYYILKVVIVLVKLWFVIFQEMTFREFETACEQSSACSHSIGLARTRCIRECVSPSCYRELYQGDPVK